MCGICGVWAAPGELAPNPEAVRRMTDSIAHRGPDDVGTYLYGPQGLALGFRRLSIIDLSAAGHQPMTNEDRSVWLVFNGEVYNFQQLRPELEALGHRFSSHADSETVLHGYEEWGDDVVLRLDGMFAFAVWDERRTRMLLARDRVGIKPLFYAFDKNRLVFGSEIKAVLAAPGIDRALDHVALYDYLAYNYIPAPRTAYRRIRKLPAGHRMTVDRGGLRIEQYWDVTPGGLPNITEDEAIERVMGGLRSAVRSHLVADVKVGLFLSGGMDSSTIAVEMAAAQPEPIHTFSIGFDAVDASELPFARAVAGQIHAVHHDEIVSWPQVQQQLEDVVAVYDEPFADSSSVPTMAVSRLARRHVTVALSGEGGDEVFAGYETYRTWMRYQATAQSTPAPVRGLLAGIGRGWPLSKGQGLARQFASLSRGPLERFGGLMEWIGPEERRRLVPERRRRELANHDDYWYLRKYWDDTLDPVTRLQYVDLKTYLVDDLLVKADRASMAVSLEVRVPLLDHHLVETLFAFPGALRFKNGRTKYLQRRAMAGRVPDATVTRPKRGFTPPLHQWLSFSNSAWARDMLARGAAVELGLLRPDPVAGLSTQPSYLWASKVWVLLVLETWARRERARQ